jgi:AcrR family transcriptional regulator
VSAQPGQGGSKSRPAELGPLPGGHHGLSPEQVAESQRERLLVGVANAVARDGYKGATITEIVKEASVSSRAFYENFESKEECFLAAFDAVVGHLQNLVAEAVEDEEDWPRQVVAALRAVLAFVVAEPNLARLCLVEPVTATPAIATHFRETVVSVIPYLRLGRAERPNGGALPDSTEDSLLGGLIALVSRSIVIDDPDSLSGLLPELIEFVLAPYLGLEQAKKLGNAADPI